MKKIIAVTTLALGLGAFAIPASANEDTYYGGTNYIQNGPSSSIPYSSNAGSEVRAFIGDEAAAASDIPVARKQLYQSKDDAHAQW